eukprot:gene29839-36959_t
MRYCATIAINDQAGYTVSDAGDVNADGFADVIIGAPYANLYTGIAYVVYGSATLTSFSLATFTATQGIKIYGATTNEQIGMIFGAAGDVNDDGYADIIIGSPSVVKASGGAYVIYGGPSSVTLTSVHLARLTASQGKQYGMTYVVYDQSGDSTSNVLLTALNEVFVVTGSDPLLTTYGGNVVSVIGDVNADGQMDYAIGADQANGYHGAAYLIFGHAGFNGINLNTIAMNPSQGLSYSGEYAYMYLGNAISSAGQFNTDNITDFVIASQYLGTVYVIYGSKFGLHELTLPSTNLTAEKSVTLTTNNYFWYAGTSVGHADFNGDGYSHGRVYVAYGGPNNTNASTVNMDDFTSTQGFYIRGVAQGDAFGFAVSGAGRFAGGDVDSIVIGAPCVNEQAGAAYIIYGRQNMSSFTVTASMPSDVGMIIYGAVADDLFGYSVSSIGDFNGDGHPDVIIGAPGFHDASYLPLKGKVYIIYGGSDMANIDLSSSTSFTKAQGILITGASEGDQCGISVSSAGDYNFDGYPDVIIGCPYAGSNTGVSYVIFGGLTSTLPSTIDLSDLATSRGFSIWGANTYDSAGFSVTGSSDNANNGLSANFQCRTWNNVYAVQFASVAFHEHFWANNESIFNAIEWAYFTTQWQAIFPTLTTSVTRTDCTTHTTSVLGCKRMYLVEYAAFLKSQDVKAERDEKEALLRRDTISQPADGDDIEMATLKSGEATTTNNDGAERTTSDDSPFIQDRVSDSRKSTPRVSSSEDQEDSSETQNPLQHDHTEDHTAGTEDQVVGDPLSPPNSNTHTTYALYSVRYNNP